jgi:hypothetical protein
MFATANRLFTRHKNMNTRWAMVPELRISYALH